jgi:hypothetical protein
MGPRVMSGPGSNHGTGAKLLIYVSECDKPVVRYIPGCSGLHQCACVRRTLPFVHLGLVVEYHRSIVNSQGPYGYLMALVFKRILEGWMTY